MYTTFVLNLWHYSQTLLAKQKQNSIDKVGRYPVVTNHFVSVNESVGCQWPCGIPQHKLERVFHSLFSTFGHNGTPGHWVQIVLCQIIHGNNVGPVKHKIDRYLILQQILIIICTSVLKHAYNREKKYFAR